MNLRTELFLNLLISFACLSCVELNLGDKTVTSDAQNTTTENNANPFEESEAIPTEPEPVCKPIDPSNIRVGESAAEQYWERFVLGINRAELGDLTVDLNR